MSEENLSNEGGLQPHYKNYQRQKCFIAYSEQAYWTEDLLSACQAVLSQPEIDLEADYARKYFHPDIPLRQKALELIANARYGIYDLSSWRDTKGDWHLPCNVFIELGMAIALNRPTLLMRHASNRDLELPECLQSLSEQILEFSGETTLKNVLSEKLPQWLDTSPEQDWRNRYCHFGNRVCEYREAHPKAKQWDQKTLHCHVADGPDIDRPDFRGVVEDVLERFRDVTYNYLDTLPLAKGYSFLLCSHCQVVRSSPFAVYRISPHTAAEAYITIGISLALESQFDLKIPKILLTEDKRNIPSLLEGYEFGVAKSDKQRKQQLQQFLPKIIDKVRSLAWHPRPLPFLQFHSQTISTSGLVEKVDVESQLGKLSKKIDVIREISWAIGETVDVSDTLDLITRRTTEVMDVDSCSIYLYNESRDKLVLAASTGLNQKGIGRYSIPDGEGLTGWAAVNRKPIAMQDAFIDPRFYRILGSGETKHSSLMAMPLVSRGRVIGAANVQTVHPRSFTEDEIELVGFFIEWASLAVALTQQISRNWLTILEVLFQKNATNPSEALHSEDLASEMKLPWNHIQQNLSFLKEKGHITLRDSGAGTQTFQLIHLTQKGIDLLSEMGTDVSGKTMSSFNKSLSQLLAKMTNYKQDLIHLTKSSTVDEQALSDFERGIAQGIREIEAKLRSLQR